MIDVSDEQFEELISQSMEELPKEYVERLDNVAITFADKPDAEQRKRLKLRCHESLYGLYEGIPRTERGAGYNLVLPDKITLFKQPMLGSVRTLTELKAQVKNTLWHEIAHHYGLGHRRIHELEDKMKQLRRNEQKNS